VDLDGGSTSTTARGSGAPPALRGINKRSMWQRRFCDKSVLSLLGPSKGRRQAKIEGSTSIDKGEENIAMEIQQQDKQENIL
jgi:hypothetical protein